MGSTNLEFLIPTLRRHLGDYEEPYTYTDSVLSGFLLDAIKALGNRWKYRYVVLSDNLVQRNVACVFTLSEPPVIQYADERAIILQASIILKSSKRWTEAGGAVSWQDEEISFSNIQSAKQYSSSVDDDMRELNSLFPVKLARPISERSYGWKKEYE